MDMKYGDKMIAFGLNIVYYRKLKLLTQEQLAEKANVSIGTIQKLENPNLYAGTTLDTLCKIAGALQMTESELLDFRNHKMLCNSL